MYTELADDDEPFMPADLPKDFELTPASISGWPSRVIMRITDSGLEFQGNGSHLLLVRLEDVTKWGHNASRLTLSCKIGQLDFHTTQGEHIARVLADITTEMACENSVAWKTGKKN